MLAKLSMGLLPVTELLFTVEKAGLKQAPTISEEFQKYVKKHNLSDNEMDSFGIWTQVQSNHVKVKQMKTAEGKKVLVFRILKIHFDNTWRYFMQGADNEKKDNPSVLYILKLKTKQVQMYLIIL